MGSFIPNRFQFFSNLLTDSRETRVDVVDDEEEVEEEEAREEIEVIGEGKSRPVNFIRCLRIRVATSSGAVEGVVEAVFHKSNQPKRGREGEREKETHFEEFLQQLLLIVYVSYLSSLYLAS